MSRTEELEREIRILRRKLRRSEANRQRLEDHKEAAIHLHKRIVTELAEANERMHASELAAQRAHAVKSQFLANMSHELRTPLNGILGTTELLSRTPLDATQSQFAQRLMRSGRALVHLVDDILDVARLESTTVELAAAPFDPGAALEDVVAIFADSAHQSDIELVCDVVSSRPVIGDGARFRQIVSNLLGNAVKFTESGWVVATLSCEPTAEPDTVSVRLVVEDSGIGFPEDALEAVFRLLQPGGRQLDAPIRRHRPGTCIVREVTALMGGTVRAENHAEGARVSCEFPADAAPATTSDTPAFEPARVRLCAGAGRRGDAMRRQLERLGATVVADGAPRDVDVVVLGPREPVPLAVTDVPRCSSQATSWTGGVRAPPGSCPRPPAARICSTRWKT